MKNLFIHIFAAATIGGFITFASVVTQNPAQINTRKQDNIQNRIVSGQLQTEDVPQLIKSAVATKYAAYAIQEAYKGDDNTYKLILKNADVKLIVYYKTKGEFLKAEAVQIEKMVIIA